MPNFEAIIEGHVFAHLCNSPTNVYMLRRWDGSDGQYQKFLERYRQLWARGNHWVVRADIASYYDSIDHELLCQKLRSQFLDGDEIIELLKLCLRKWTPHEDGIDFARGLPQGYETSDYLATLFLLPTDESMIQQCKYLRYVDDIRILATNRDTASRALIELDIALKKQALILQPAKTGAREVQNIQEEMDNLAATLSIIDSGTRRGEDVDDESEELFLKSWNALDNDEHAEAHIVFALNRMSPSDKVKPSAIELLSKLPWRSNSISNYLGEFLNDTEVIDALLKEIGTHKVYAWHLANCIRALAKITSANVFRDIAREWISTDQLKWYLKLAAVESLQHDPESYNFLLLKFKQEPNYLVRSAILVASAFCATTDAQRALVIRHGLKDKNSQVVGTAVWLYLEYPECGLSDDEFGMHLGVHRKMIPTFSNDLTPGACFIEKTFIERFGVTIPPKFEFRQVFDPDYDVAVDRLRRATRYYDTDPTIFVLSIDNFNQVVSVKMSEKLTGKNIPKDDYTNILGHLKNTYGTIATIFLDCHKLRSDSEGPHAWATSLGSWSKSVSHYERDRVVKNLGTAYQEFVYAFCRMQGIIMN